MNNPPTALDDGLLLHPATRLNIESAISKSPQSILIHGPQGSGKLALSRYLSARLLDIDNNKLNNYPYFIEIGHNDNKITIDDIRDVQALLKLKVPINKESHINRIVTIADSQRMSQEAQNALLKTIEEPPLKTALILTAPQQTSLLPTILSRIQSIEILPISLAMAKQFYEEFNIKNLDSLVALSRGQAGLLQALISNSEHPLIADISLAKSILAKDKGSRLLEVDQIAKDKDAANRLLDALLRISHAAIQASSKKNDRSALNKWQITQQAITETMDNYLSKNANYKLALDNLFINL